ncbi:P27 family phage terminase small subunit [Oceanobacillus jordanicus]|uniref:P27 family phage terminase small subunit n=1 Tax=Oceanobacillus jordanicus TaxID=2867266 RepID=A0AAW5B6I1_9BACI|nr:P27 family phage terminase small subunit [Oceanobacillus jordanicus]
MSRTVKITELEKQLLLRIDSSDLVEIDKVKRYVALVKQTRKLQTEINKHGVLTKTVNGSQEFMKANPAIKDLNSLTKTLISLEKSIKFEMINPPVLNEDKKDNDEPEVSDLY